MDSDDTAWPVRKSLRLPRFDYATHHDYFVTLCVQGRRRLLGRVEDGRLTLSDAGRMIDAQWRDLARRYPFVALDRHIVMPNHVHGIVGLRADRRTGVAITETLGSVIRRFKALTTRLYCDGVRRHGWRRFDGRLWQRGFYDRVIRNDRELNAIREYIDQNPARWERDSLNPDRGGGRVE
jgi:REP element-mobilizing transposase RayT